MRRNTDTLQLILMLQLIPEGTLLAVSSWPFDRTFAAHPSLYQVVMLLTNPSPFMAPQQMVTYLQLLHTPMKKQIAAWSEGNAVVVSLSGELMYMSKAKQTSHSLDHSYAPRKWNTKFVFCPQCEQQ